MPTPPASFLRLQAAYRRGRSLTILAEGDQVVAELHADPDPVARGWQADAELMIGLTHATQERLGAACAYLEHGLSIAPASATTAPPPRSPGTRFGRAPNQRNVPPPLAATPAGPFGTPGPFGTGDLARPPEASPFVAPATGRRSAPAGIVESAELVLLDLYLQTGRYADALERITPLLDPHRAPTTRFTATRAQAAVAAARGDDETAHHLLNTATALAGRIPSRFRNALVEGDRAILLASQGRLLEGISTADRVLANLVRPLVGDYQLWSNAEAAAIALTLSRACAHAGDQLSAQRMLHTGTAAARQLPRAYFHGHLVLARSVVLEYDGRFDEAEAGLVDALGIFHTHGYRPAAAITVLEQARLAHARGLVRSALPRYAHAFEELRDLGQLREARLARAMASPIGEIHAGAAPS